MRNLSTGWWCLGRVVGREVTGSGQGLDRANGHPERPGAECEPTVEVKEHPKLLARACKQQRLGLEGIRACEL